MIECSQLYCDFKSDEYFCTGSVVRFAILVRTIIKIFIRTIVTVLTKSHDLGSKSIIHFEILHTDQV